jgi:flagellar hook-length control protein FliK
MAISIAAATKLPANANAAQASIADAASNTMGADLFASLLGAELGQFDSGAGKTVKTDDLADTKAAKSDKSSIQNVNSDAAAQILLPGAVLALPTINTAQQANGDGADGQQAAATVTAVEVAVQSAEDKGSQLGGPLKKTAEGQNLPQDGSAAVQFLPLTQPNGGNSAHSSTPVQMTIQTPLQDQAWGKAFGDQVLGMVSLKADSAHIQVNPQELGPIDVTLKLDDNNQAQLTFVTSTPQAREAVENSLPRLSSMLQAGGIQLAGAQVSTGQGQQQQAFAQQQQRKQQGEQSDEPDTLAAIKAARGVLSIFA